MNKFSFIELAILRMLENEALHGYGMSAKMQQYSDGDLNLPAGSLYPALHKLERSKLIESSLQPVGGRKRRVYTITPAGHTALEKEISSWNVMVRTMSALLEAA